MTSEKFKEDWENLISKCDVDGDKVINPSEMKELIAHCFKVSADSQDGTEQDNSSICDALYQAFEEYLKKFDENKDGVWSQDELQGLYQDIYDHAKSLGMIKDD